MTRPNTEAPETVFVHFPSERVFYESTGHELPDFVREVGVVYSRTDLLASKEAEIARLITLIKQTDKDVHLIEAQCGTPDAAEGCRLILKTAARIRTALQPTEETT
jgi:hypothetical protein